MKTLRILLLILIATGLSLKAEDQPPPNPMIDYNGFMANAAEVGKLRATHRVTEQDFLRMSAEAGTIIFDARNDAKYAMIHVKGSVHLDLTNATEADLAKVIPDKTTRILIYCNNNFENEPRALRLKAPPTSLNIYTFNTLYGYGYKNVYELGPLLDIKKTILPFEGTLVTVQK
jgi:phage shock protein E